MKQLESYDMFSSPHLVFYGFSFFPLRICYWVGMVTLWIGKGGRYGE